MHGTLYLSPIGDDTQDGTRFRPVASLARAVTLARARFPGKRRIRVADGAYFGTDVVLDARDSGLEVVAASGSSPAFYGGGPVTGWRPEGGDSPYLVADVPGVREGARDFRALVVNGRFAIRARFPECGAIQHASRFDVRWMSTTKGGWERKPTMEELTTLDLVPGSLPATLDARNAELTIYHCWDESLVGVQRWDRSRDRIIFTTPAGHPPGAFGGWKEQARTFVVWNVREGMTRPGQWYLDRTRGLLVYWPLEGESSASIAVIAPEVASVLRLAGTAECPVENVRLKGLTCGVTTTPLIAGGFGANAFAGVIEGDFAHGLRLDKLVVRWAGGQGIRLRSSDNVRCRGCDVYDVGAGGIALSGKDGIVRDTLIHHNGRTYPSALGLRVHGERWRVCHNTLHHTPYSAITAGGKQLRFEHNRFHHVMEELVDGAAIYVFAAKSCLLRGNYTYDLRDEQVHAYYLDEQSADSRVEGNVAVGVPWPIHNHMAWNCVVRDNVCISAGDLHISFPNCDAFTLARNVFVCDGVLAFDPSYTGVSRLSGNVFHSGCGAVRWNFHDRLPTLDRNAAPVPALPSNQGSVIADPGCRCRSGKVTYANLELARALKLRALDVSQAGCGRE